MSGHVRFGSRDGGSFAVRLMEDVPLQTFGNVTLEGLLHPAPALELGPVLGLDGPYDGATLGVKGRVWFTPEAAAQVRACFGGVDQFGVSVGVAARWPARERRRPRAVEGPAEP